MEEDTEARAHVPLLGPTGSGSGSGRLGAGAGWKPAAYGALGTNHSSSPPLPLGNIKTATGVDRTDQGGVQQADAINLVWSQSSLVVAYAFIFLCSFAQALQWQIISNLTPYVTSEFSAHSVIPTISLISSILSGVLKLPISKLIDARGRPQGLASMTLLATIGLVLMTTCRNVRTYAAAQVGEYPAAPAQHTLAPLTIVQVLYSVGLSGFQYILSIIVADTSSLKNRALAIAFSSSPNIITSLIGPVIARAFYEKSNWRWAFGTSAVLFFVLSLPILLILMWNAHKAAQLGFLHHDKSPSQHKASSPSIRYYWVEYDATGNILVTLGLTMILVPLSFGNGAEEYLNVISVSLGVFFLLVFGAHEHYSAARPVMPFKLLLSRNVAGSCLMSIIIFVSYFCWDSYYSSYLQVVHGLDMAQAGYIDHIYGLLACVWAVMVGYLIRVSDRYKWLAIAALPVHIFGGFSLILFRRPDTSVGLLILSQVLIAVGASTLVVSIQISVMAVSSHGELASVLAVLSLAAYVGSAGGNSLSGAIWNSTLPKALAARLPGLSAGEISRLCSDLTAQLKYPIGHPVRDAIIVAYDQAQVRMCLTGTMISLLEIVGVAMWRNTRVSDNQQVKGKVV